VSIRKDPSSKPPLWPYLVFPASFLLLVLAGPAYYWLSVAQYGTLESAPDANIGAALGIMWTAIWGLPWSAWPWTSSTVEQWSGHATEAIFVACALFNVVLLTVFMFWLRRRATEPHTRAGQTA
jgi:hypothetical protein